MAELATGGGQRVVKLIVRIVHLIDVESCFQTSLVKWLVVSHQWKTFYQRFYLRPYFWETRCIIRVFMTKTMNLRTPIVIIVRLRLDERVERINYLAIANNDDSYRAYAATLIVGRLKIYGCKISHTVYFVLCRCPCFMILLQRKEGGMPICSRGLKKTRIYSGNQMKAAASQRAWLMTMAGSCLGIRR